MSEKMGVIISLEKYQENEFGLPKVKYATNDSESMKKIFTDVLEINEENIYCFKDEQFSFMTGKSELQYYLKQMAKDTELFLYYAGHGFFYEGVNYLTVYDTSTIDLVATSLSFEELFLNSFRCSGAKSCVAFIDACAEGIGIRQRSIGFRGLDMGSARIIGDIGYRYALYFSCSPKEKSMSDDRLQHGIWTWFLIKALQGDEDAFDQGNYISTTSLERYLKKSVNNFLKHGKVQTPYSVISTESSWKLVEYGQQILFDELVCEAYGEFLFQCNSVNQELNLGGYGEIQNFQQARTVCFNIKESLCYDWERIVVNLEYYFYLVNEGRGIELPYSEQKKLLEDFERLNNSFPTYINSL